MAAFTREANSKDLAGFKGGDHVVVIAGSHSKARPSGVEPSGADDDGVMDPSAP